MFLVCGMLCVRVMILNYSQEAASEVLRGQIISRQNTDAADSKARMQSHSFLRSKLFSPYGVLSCRVFIFCFCFFGMKFKDLLACMSC